MPPLPPVPGVVRVVFNGTYQGRPTASIIYMGEPGNATAWTQAQADAVATAARAEWVARFLPQQNAVWTLNNVTATDLTNFLGVVGTAVGTNAGANAGTPLSANVTACISWKSNIHYRGGHPRMYLPAPGSTSTPATIRTWSAAYVTSLGGAAEIFRGNLIGIYSGRASRMVAVHRTVGGVVQNPPLFLPIVLASLDNRIDSQRRRLGPDVAA